jgi:hypothetical protein
MDAVAFAAEHLGADLAGVGSSKNPGSINLSSYGAAAAFDTAAAPASHHVTTGVGRTGTATGYEDEGAAASFRVP